MTTSLIALRDFGLAFGEHVVLASVSFDLPATGLTVLVGPAGGGKSTLLRTLSGHNSAHPSLTTWGTVMFDGVPQNAGSELGTGAWRPVLVMQHARFFLDSVRENLASALPNRSSMSRVEQTRAAIARLGSSGLSELVQHLDTDVVSLPIALQRRMAIARALVSEPRALFVDEPTAGLEAAEAAEILGMLRAEAKTRCVLLVTHHQGHAVAAGGTTLLLAGGKIQESNPTDAFFSAPQTPLGRDFLRTGGCIAPCPRAPDPSPYDSTPPAPVAPAAATRSRFMGPRGFFWVEPDRLGGCPRPGIIDRLDHDIEGLARLKVSILITLEEQRLVSIEELAAHSIVSVHYPIVDMQAPSIEPTLALCRRVHEWTTRGEVVAYHCRAGLGRTGTLLACQRIWSGKPARDAIEEIRSINPRCIQSVVQISFLRALETAVDETRMHR